MKLVVNPIFDPLATRPYFQAHVYWMRPRSHHCFPGRCRIQYGVFAGFCRIIYGNLY